MQKTSFQTAIVKRENISGAEIKIWALDYPAHERLVDFGQALLRIQGWVLWSDPLKMVPELIVAVNGVTVHTQAFNTKRPDVVERVLHERAENHVQLCCGFIAQIAAEKLTSGFQVGVRADGVDTWLAQVDFTEPMKVLEGSEGWLFLDNDSNHSVDQYIGQRMLGTEELNLWREYLSAVQVLAQRTNMRHALVIAPSKEEVLPHRYPFNRAQTTVLDQVCALAKPEWNVVNAAPVLAAYTSPEACFKKTDTHWTDRGAMLAVMAVLERLELDVRKAEALFAKDVYEIRQEVGDLGCKMLPIRSAETEFLKTPMPEQDAVFDNGLPNIGRALVFENGLAIYPWKMVIFGASSSYPMLKYLKRLFRRLVFVHSAAQVDKAVLLHEQPDFLLLQSNGRFLVQPPNLSFSLTDAVFRKTAEATSAFRVKLQKYIAENNFSEKDSLYVQMVSKALEKSIEK